MRNILVTRSSMPKLEEYIDEIKSIWETRWLTNMGEKHERLQNELEKYLKVPFVSLCTNGHNALELAIQALGLKGEIITTPFTFVSTTEAIIRMGCKPVFCDIKEEDFTIDESKIEELINDKTCAIMPVHVYGNVCNVKKIKEIADKYNLKVIYDAAHAFGVEYKKRGVAEYGDISVFSFHATKVFNTIEGGAVCSHDESITNYVKIIRDFGITNTENIEVIGTNAKMNEFSAAMGLCNLRHVDDEIAKRKKVFATYWNELKDVKGIRLLHEVEDLKRNYAYFPVIIDEKEYGHSRNELFDVLKTNGIYTRKYFYPLTNQLDCIKNRFDVGKTPIANYLANRVLTLPMYSDLEEETVRIICKVIREFYFDE